MSTFVLMAGGTAGHLFAAHAVAEEFERRGHKVHITTDHRIEAYGDKRVRFATHIVPAATFGSKAPVALMRSGMQILKGIFQSFKLMRRLRPDGVIAFGGYPSFPPFLAASLMGVPGVLVEQNAVMGRANRALLRFADAVAVKFAKTKYLENFNGPVEETGNPVRSNVIAAAQVPYVASQEEQPFELVIFAGSQGARAFSDFIPQAIVGLDEGLRKRLRIVQQCRKEDLERVSKIYSEAQLNVELSTFFADMPDRIAKAHLVIGRGGSSTITELCVIGRPAIIVPLPNALDQDQLENGKIFVDGGGGIMVEQAALTPEWLAEKLSVLMNDPEQLNRMANGAKSMSRADAVVRIADFVEVICGAEKEGQK